MFHMSMFIYLMLALNHGLDLIMVSSPGTLVPAGCAGTNVWLVSCPYHVLVIQVQVNLLYLFLRKITGTMV